MRPEREKGTMVFLASRVLVHDLDTEARLRLLERLQERDFVPLIRSTRLRCFGQTVSTPELVADMERLIATGADSDEQSQYLPGDLFCFDDHVFFILFGEQRFDAAG